MRARLKTFFSSSVFRYLVTGVLGFVAELLTIWIAKGLFQASSLVAVGISFWVGMLASFLMQKLFTFRDKRRAFGTITRQTLSFVALVAINYAFTLVVVAFLDPIWNSPELARALALLITTAWNYLAYRFIIFR